MSYVDYLFLKISYSVKVTFHQTKHFFCYYKQGCFTGTI